MSILHSLVFRIEDYDDNDDNLKTQFIIANSSFIIISIMLRNPYTGRLSAGFRFRFNVRAISHRPVYLPLEMKELSQIKLLMQGSSPLEVFNRLSIQSARKAFNDLRKQFDFPFWAATEYSVYVFRSISVQFPRGEF